MREVRELIRRVADTDVTVLVRGESGTGKELVARAVHAASQRRDQLFVKVNCAALPSELLESELFGFERGAFTGATQQKPGKFEFANHGTIFLDEIGELQASMQAKLLQVLQDGEFARLGSNRDVRVDVRVVAATNRDLEQASADGQFREDLLFRLNVVSITVPPLRQRRDEIPALSDFFLRHYSEQYNKPTLTLSSETLRTFGEYDWPGNVRELENLMKRMVILGSGETIRCDLEDSMTRRSTRSPRSQALPTAQVVASTAPGITPMAAPVQPTLPTGSLKEIARHAAREAERDLIFKTLQQTRWNRREAAGRLGISYKALLYKIKEADAQRI
jgi:two-component system response regulator AtoC